MRKVANKFFACVRAFNLNVREKRFCEVSEQWSVIPSGMSLLYLRFVSISNYCLCRDLLVLITIALRLVSIDTNLFLIDSFHLISSSLWLSFLSSTSSGMASTRRTPHNIYTQKRADRQFQDFVQHAKSNNLPIPLAVLPNELASDDNHPNARKKQKLAPGQVHFNFLLFFWSTLILFISSLS